MKKKMPQSSKTHVYDKRARKNLEEFFPEHWKMTKQQDDDSGIEYGEDWLVQIPDEQNQLTGAKFYIQSKSTEKPLRGRRIGMKLKVSTLNYLQSLTLPVILHYHHAPTNTGYWMWFDEFYEREYSVSWERKDEITVYIPTKNLLNEKAVKEITSVVLHFHRLQLLQKQANTASKISQHFSFRFETDEKHTSLSVYAKHPSALEQNPIELNLMVDAEGNRVLSRLFDFGEKIEIDGKITINGLPEWMVTEVNELEKMRVTLVPHVQDRRSHLRIQFLKEKGECLFESNVVEMQLAQEGQKYALWEGRSTTQPVIYTFAFDLSEPETRFNILFDSKTQSVVELHWYLSMLQLLKDTKHVAIYNLDTGGPPYNLSSTPEITSVSEEFRRTIASLALIASTFHLDINIPDNIKQSDLLFAQGIKEIVESGRTSNPLLLGVNPIMLQAGKPLKLVGVVALDAVRDIERNFEEKGVATITLPAQSVVTFLDTEIELGPGQYTYFCTEIIDIEQEQKDTVNMHLAFDLEKSYVQYQNWSREVAT